MSGISLPLLIVLAVLGVLAGFFRKILVVTLIVLLAQIILFALFPNLLVAFVKLVTSIHLVR
jgi:hypothetical protein